MKHSRMLSRIVAGILVGFAVLTLTACGESITLKVNFDSSCSGLVYVDADGDETQYIKPVQAGTVEIIVTNSRDYDRRLALLVDTGSLPTDMEYVNDRDGFQPVVAIDALEDGQLIAIEDIAPNSQTSFSSKLKAGTYLILDPKYIYCEEPLELVVK